MLSRITYFPWFGELYIYVCEVAHLFCWLLFTALDYFLDELLCFYFVFVELFIQKSLKPLIIMSLKKMISEIIKH